MGVVERVTWRLAGMDCASCVAKVTKAVERLPGVSAVDVNLMAERLSITLEPGASSVVDVEARVGTLGYAITRLDPAPEQSRRDHHDHDHDHDQHPHDHAFGHGHSHGHDDPGDLDKPWWNTGRARLVWVLAGLVGTAWIASALLPERLTAPLYVAATAIALVPFGRRAIALARAGTPFSIETLMCLAAIGAAVIGAAGEAAVVVLLFAVGELLETVAAARARTGIRALAGLMPREALLLRADGTVEAVPLDRLSPGELVLVRPGDRVPCDGIIEDGQSGLDESAVTGESMPLVRGPGDPVLAGSINTDAVLQVRVTRSRADNTIARILRLVEDATASRAPTERFIERFSRWWTPGAMLVSSLVIVVPPFALGWDWWTSVYRGLAVLLIACPCALVISVPAAIASGLATGARRGLLIKGGAALEALGAARVVAFDKTGTLTEGRPRVTDLLPVEGTGELDLLRMAAGAEAGSSHPLAKAVLDEAARRGIAVPPAQAATAMPGMAVAATIEGRRIGVGSPVWAAGCSVVLAPSMLEASERLEIEGKTVAVVTADREFLGLIAMRDEPREDAALGIASLGSLGLRAIMLTGDNPRTAAAIAGRLGIEARAGLRPEDKLREIAALQAQAPVVMVGDGINDAPALAAASVGVAMGGGTDVALETADAAVLRDRVSGVADLVALSRATLRTIRQNVAVAVGLKLLFLVTTVAGVTGLWPAILADTGATVLVTLNALRLLRWQGMADAQSVAILR